MFENEESLKGKIMSQSGPIPPVHARRNRPEIIQNNANEAIPAARFGETEWEARDVSVFNFNFGIL